MSGTWQAPERHDHGDSLCGPGCRYRGMYESSQKSLEDMAQNHTEARKTHRDLREGLISLAKRMFRGEVTEIERKGHKIGDVDDEALLMYLEGFISAMEAKRKADYGEMSSLRAVLEQKGYQLPDSNNVSAWVAAIAAQSEDGDEVGFASSEELSGVGGNLDQELAQLLEAEGLHTEVEPGTASAPENPVEDSARSHEPGEGGPAEETRSDDDLSGLFEEDSSEGGSVEGADDLAAILEDDLDLDEELGGADTELADDFEESGAGEDGEEIEPEVFDPADDSSDTESDGPESPTRGQGGDAGRLEDIFGADDTDDGGESGDGGSGEDGERAGSEELTELFGGEEPEMTPTSARELSDLFADDEEPQGSESSEESGGDALANPDEQKTGESPAPGGVNAPKPAFMTPGEAVGTKIRPELMKGAGEPSRAQKKESKKPAEKAQPKQRAQRPERLRFDVPDLEEAERRSPGLSEELGAAMLAAVETHHPVFTSDLEKIAGSREIAEAWETEMRSVDNPPVRFLSPRSHHRDKGSLALPHRLRVDPPPEFSKTWWGRSLESGHRGNVLYEMAVVLAAFEEYVVSWEITDHLVSVRANLPHGLTGIIIVCGDDLEGGEATAEAVLSQTEEMISERLATIMVLAVRRGREDRLADLIAETGAEKGWDPAMPVAVDLSWKYADGKGSTAKVALGGM